MLATKTEFAKIANVSAGRISQYITEGKITAAEMEGFGRNAKIKVPEALAKLSLRIDPGQRLGNGINTNLQIPIIPLAEPKLPEGTANDQLDTKLKQAKLLEAEARNRKLAEEENLRRGIYMLAADASSEGSKLVAKVLQMFESGVTDMARDVASTYKLPERDVIHMLRKKFRDMRVQMTASLGDDIQTLSPLVEDQE